MRAILDFLEPFKTALIILGVFLLFYLGVFKIYPMVADVQTQATPIVKIKAKNETQYTKDMTIDPEDFTVSAIHENGKTTTLSPEEYTVSRKKVNPVGKTTPVTITVKENKKLTVSLDVKNKRDPVIRFNVGTPNLKDVKAVLYNNGELCFEGKGDVLQFNDFPWLDYDEMNDYPIESITFEGGVTPTSMDEWFAGIETLTYVGTLPSSVESLAGTFEECTGLTKGADWSQCANLKNLTRTYASCTSLTQIPAIPATVTLSEEMCEDCSSLVQGADVSGAEALEYAQGMYRGCTNLVSVTIPPKAKDITSILESCINLKAAPQIPESVSIMDSAFYGDISLVTLSKIPAAVTNLNRCFSDCAKIAGTIEIDANPEDYSGWLNSSVVASKLDVTGKSGILNDLVWESGNPYVTVNGKAAVDPDVLAQQQEEQRLKEEQEKQEKEQKKQAKKEAKEKKKK